MKTNTPSLRRSAALIIALNASAALLMAVMCSWAGERALFPAMLAAALALSFCAGTAAGGIARLVPLLAAGVALMLPPLPGLSLLVVAYLVQGHADATSNAGAGLRAYTAAIAVPALLALLVAETI